MRAIFAITLCSALLLCSCGRTNPAAVRVDPALASLVPPSTSILVGARLDKLRDTPVYQKHLRDMRLPRVDEFAKETGLDPRRDIWEVLFASSGPNESALMVRGKFATSELEPRLEREGATRSKYKSYSLFGDERASVFFLNASTAVAGTTPLLRRIIDARDASGGNIPAKLRPLVDAVPSNAQVWAVFDGSAISLPFAGKGGLGNLEQFLGALQNGRFSADLSKGFDFQALGNCGTEDGARQIRDLLKGVLGFGRLSAPSDQPELLRIFDAIQVAQQGPQVTVGANVPQDLVDKFLDLFIARVPRQ